MARLSAPGGCTLLRIPQDFEEQSRNIWGTKYLALCPMMRLPQDVRWDREIVYEVVWSLLYMLDKHNRAAAGGNGVKITSFLMTPLATGTCFVSSEKWASQTVLAITHFVEALENPAEWTLLRWPTISDMTSEVEETWAL